jgi:novel protein kinase C epsilon type
VVNVPKIFDPYIAVDIDEAPLARTQTKLKTLAPVWNEEMSSHVRNGQCIGFTVFHDCAIPPDEFVANCTLAFEDIIGTKKSDIWVMAINNLFLVHHKRIS